MNWGRAPVVVIEGRVLGFALQKAMHRFDPVDFVVAVCGLVAGPNCGTSTDYPWVNSGN